MQIMSMKNTKSEMLDLIKTYGIVEKAHLKEIEELRQLVIRLSETLNEIDKLIDIIL